MCLVARVFSSMSVKTLMDSAAPNNPTMENTPNTHITTAGIIATGPKKRAPNRKTGNASNT